MPNGRVSFWQRFFRLSFMRVVFPNLLPCLPSLASGLVPAGHHYYEALNPQLRASQVCGTAEVSPLISIELPNIPSPTTILPFRSPQFGTLRFCHRARRLTNLRSLSATRSRASSEAWREVRGSRFTRTLPDRLGRIEFTSVTDCSFASSCIPPFLLKTQLPSAPER